MMENFFIRIAFFGHAAGTPLAKPDTMTAAAPNELKELMRFARIANRKIGALHIIKTGDFAQFIAGQFVVPATSDDVDG